MSRFHNARRKRGLFNPASPKPFRLSRSKLELYLGCARCFYLDRRLGVARPPGFPFNLNSAVDALLKKEFDAHRVHGTKHPLQSTYGIEAVPFQHLKMEIWRNNFKGVEHHHQPTNLIICGAVDDIWITPQKELIVVDYKATSKTGQVGIDADWQIGYRRQMETYQWLLRRNNFKVSNTGYFVYCNGRKDRQAFDGKLEFDVKIVPYRGSDDWVEPAIIAAKACLLSPSIPGPAEDCDYCSYVSEIEVCQNQAPKITAKQVGLFESLEG